MLNNELLLEAWLVWKYKFYFEKGINSQENYEVLRSGKWRIKILKQMWRPSNQWFFGQILTILQNQIEKNKLPQTFNFKNSPIF